MKKTILLSMLSLLMALTLTVSACAEGELASLYNTFTDLAFDTDNVAVDLTATFTLDGLVFKEAHATHIQCGPDFYRNMELSAPIGEHEFENGYTILAQDGESTVIDSYSHSIHYHYSDPDRHGILRRSVSLNTLAQLGRGIAPLMENALPEGAVRRDSANSIRISIEADDVPPVVNAMLMQLLQYAGTRTRYIFYDLIPYRFGDPDLYDYTTVTEGILFCTNDVSLRKAELEITEDDAGRIRDVTGSGTMILWTGENTVHELAVDFHMTASGYGTAELPDFVPERDSRWFIDYSYLDGEEFGDQNRTLTVENVYSFLTEVYGYDVSELDSFVIEQGDGFYNFYQADHPSWVYTVWAPGEGSTPFATDYVRYPGEGSVRYFLWLAHKNSWPTANQSEAMKEYMANFCIDPNERLAAMLNGETDWTKEEFVREVFRSCYGPEDGWSEPLVEWCAEACESFKEQ